MSKKKLDGKTNVVILLLLLIIATVFLTLHCPSPYFTATGNFLEVVSNAAQCVGADVISIKPATAPNLIYATPLMLLLVLLFAILALNQEKLSERVKYALTALHVALLTMVGLLLIFTFIQMPLTGSTISMLATQFSTNGLMLAVPMFVAGLSMAILTWVFHSIRARKSIEKL